MQTTKRLIVGPNFLYFRRLTVDIICQIKSLNFRCVFILTIYGTIFDARPFHRYSIFIINCVLAYFIYVRSQKVTRSTTSSIYKWLSTGESPKLMSFKCVAKWSFITLCGSPTIHDQEPLALTSVIPNQNLIVHWCAICLCQSAISCDILLNFTSLNS